MHGEIKLASTMSIDSCLVSMRAGMCSDAHGRGVVGKGQDSTGERCSRVGTSTIQFQDDDG